MTGFSSEEESVSREASPAVAAESVQLGAIEAAIREARDVEDWQRDALLSQVRSLDDFYRAHRPV